VFKAFGSADLEKREVTLAFAGRYKVISAGLEYKYSEGGHEISLLIRGNHKFDNATGKWFVAVGYKNDRVVATGSGEYVKQLDEGRKLFIGGSVSVASVGEEAVDLEMALEAKCEFKHGEFVIKAVGSWDGEDLEYRIELGASVKTDRGKLALVLTLDNDDEKEISLLLKYEPEMDSFLRKFDIGIKRDENGDVSISGGISGGFMWVDGVFLPFQD